MTDAQIAEFHAAARPERKTKSAILDLLYRAEQLILEGDRFEATPLIRQIYAAVRDDVPDY